MKEITYDLTKLVSVEVRKGNKVNCLTWRNKKEYRIAKIINKKWWKEMFEYEEGYYVDGGNNFHTEEQLANKEMNGIRILCKDHVAYHRPHVRLSFDGGQIYCINLDTIAECEEVAKKYKKYLKEPETFTFDA